jgi:hypothetical protein
MDNKLGRTSAAFAPAAVISILFNTVLACVKDAYPPLSRAMGRLAGHNWTTQGIIDVALFLGIGFLFLQTGWAANIAPKRLITILAVATVLACVGLGGWYALF